jgi:hypothetical protein
MERLLMLQLESGGCAAEAQLNGLPVAALGAGGGRVALAVHEYTLTGRNQLAIVAAPTPPGRPATPQPRVATVPTWARARLVLARQGQSANDSNARVLAAVEWAATEGKPYEAPTTTAREVELPVNFPRWRWLDAPQLVLAPPVARQILEFIQLQAVELGHGNPDPMLAACKLRFDELAVAYQRDAAGLVQRFRDHLQRLFEAKSLKVVPPTAEELVLRPLADGRLIECLSPLGGPVLRTQNDDPVIGNHAWPVRLAMVEGRIYVLR